MDERVVKFRVGVMVLACLLILGILIALLGGLPTLFQRTYSVHIEFPQTPGVSVGTPVRMSGILIGRVTKVELVKDSGVVVSVAVHSEYALKRNEAVRITGSLLGDAIIEFVPNRAPAPPLVDGDYITGTVTKNPLEVLGSVEWDLGQAIGSVSLAGAEIGRLATHLNDLLVNNDEQINRIVNKTEKALDTFQRSMTNIDGIMGDPHLQEELRTSLAQLPELLKEAHSAVNSFDKTMGSADRNLKNMEGFTGPLGERGPHIVAGLDETVSRLDGLLEQFAAFGQALNSSDGSLSQFVKNPELYQNISAAACNIEELTRKLRPIVNDARIFADKIARHPEVLGVSGAIKKSPGIK